MSVPSINSQNNAASSSQGNASEAATLHLLHELAKRVGSEQASQASTKEMVDSMTTLADMLGELAEKVSQMMQNTNKDNLGVGQALIDQATTQLNNVLKQIKAQEAAQHQHHWWDIFAKVIGCIVGAVMAIVGLVTANPALVVGGALVIVLVTTPAIKDLTNLIAEGISDALQADGVPKSEADRISKVIAGIIIVAIVIAVAIATCGAGSGAAAETAAEVGAEEGTEMTTIASENAATDGSESAAADTSEGAGAASSESSGVMSKVQTALRFLNGFNRLSRTTNIAIAAGSQAISATGLIQNTMACIAGGSKNEKEWERDLGMALSVLNMIVGVLAGGTAMGQAGQAASRLGSIGRSLAQLRGYLANSLPVTQIVSALINLEILSGIAQAGGEAGQAVTLVKLGKAQEKMATDQANLSIMQFANEMNNQASQNMTKSNSEALKSINEDIGKLPELAQIQEAIAHVLA